MTRHQLTYIDMHPAPVKRDWLGEILGWFAAIGCILATSLVFACWGVMLAWRG